MEYGVTRGRLRVVRAVGVLLLTLVLAFFSSGLLFASGEEAAGDRITRLRGSGSKGVVVIVPEKVETYKVPPETILVPVFVASESGRGRLTQVEMVFRGPGASTVAKRFIMDRNLEPAGRRLADMVKEMEGRDRKAIGALIAKGAYMELELDVSALKLSEGDQGNIDIAVNATVGTEPVTLTAQVEFQALALPDPGGWYGGDGHVHTSWSPDVWFIPLENRVKYARDNGFGFITITDHEDGINDLWATPSGYVSQCNAAQTKYLIPALPGVEITAASSRGDALGYWMNESSATVPNNQTYSCQELIDRINSHNNPYSYAVIAHPYGAHPWVDWSVQGFAAMELLSQEIVAKADTISRWFTLLRNGLASTLSSGRFVVGIGTSDCHNFQAPGFAGFTWIYTDSYSAGNRAAVWEAIKNGRVSASGRKDLGYFTINGAAQGSVLRVAPGSTLSFRLVAVPVTGRKCTKVTIFDKDQVPVYSVTNPASAEIYWNTQAPVADGFYVVKFEFTKTDGSDLSHVWANPIFIDVE